MKISTFASTITMNIYYLFIIRGIVVRNYYRLIRIILYLLIAFWMTFNITSCKTCKCPAYSKLESQNPVNARDISTLT
jgi:hypothetical protein